MSIFKKPEQIDGNAKQDPPKLSQWQGVIDDMTASHHYLNSAMNRLGKITFELQKGADFILKYRDSLVRAVEDNGGETEQASVSVEDQIKDYLPKALQREPQ